MAIRRLTADENARDIDLGDPKNWEGGELPAAGDWIDISDMPRVKGPWTIAPPLTDEERAEQRAILAAWRAEQGQVEADEPITVGAK